MNSEYYKSQIIKKIATWVLCSVGLLFFLIISSGGNFEIDGFNELLQMIVITLGAGAFFYLPFFYGSYLGIGIIGRIIASILLAGVALTILDKVPVFLSLILIFAIPGVDIGITVYKYKKAK